MFSQVIAGVDGTAGGHDAALLASKLVAPAGELTLVHVYPADESGYHGSGVNFTAIARQDSLELLATERDAIGVDAEIEAVGASSVGAGLHRIAGEHDSDLLVVGSCARGAVGRLLLGDDMRASLDGAPCAVAVAPRGYAEHPGPLATIGVAYDGTDESEAALALARMVAGEHDARIEALTVVGTPTYAYGVMVAIDWSEVLSDLEREAQARLDAFDDVEGSVVGGIPTQALARFGEEVDLLVVGSRGFGPARRMLFGSTSEYLVRHIRCPLLIVRRGVEARGEPTHATTGASGAGA